MKKYKKTKKELAIMEEGGRKLSLIRRKLIKRVRPGMTSKSLDSYAEELIKEENGKPSFKEVPGYHWATCICPNDVIVHGIPKDKPLLAGDVVGVDVGLYYRGFHTDTSDTVLIGEEKMMKKQNIERIRKFLTVGRKALTKAIEQAVVGNRIGHISQTIQQTIELEGLNVVRSLVGHGIGRKLHEWPEVPCFLSCSIDQTPKLEEGMVLAIEVIYTMGTYKVKVDPYDGWTVVTQDGLLSGLFEHTVSIGKKPKVLTR